MAVTVTADLTPIDDAEATTNWTSDTDSPAQNTSLQREGNACNGFQLSNEAGHIYRQNLGPLDLRNTRVYVWLRAGIAIGTKAQGGYRIVLGDGTNIIGYYTGGSNEPGFTFGAWVCQVIDTANLPTAFATIAGSETNLNLAQITEVGGGFIAVAKAVGNVDNCFIDIMRYGKGLVVTGGTSGDPGAFTEIIAEDEDSTNAYGIIRTLEAGVYGFQGDLTFGATGSSSTYFRDDDAVVVLENHVHASGSSTTPFQLAVYGGSGTTHFELGIPVASGDDQIGRNGVLWRNSNPLFNRLSWVADSPHVEDILLYGMNLIGAYDPAKPESVLFSPFANGADHRLSGVIFDRCGQVSLGQVVARNCTFQSTLQGTGTLGYGASALLWADNIDLKNSSFIANQFESIFGEGVSGSHGIEHPASGTFQYVGLTFASNDYDLEFSAPTGTLTIQATQGSNPGTYQITRGGVSVDIQNNKTLTLTGLQTDSEVRVYNNVGGEAGSAIAGTESSGTTFDIVYNYLGSDIPVIIVIHHLDYIYQRLFLSLGDSDASLPIVQQGDRVYDNP